MNHSRWRVIAALALTLVACALVPRALAQELHLGSEFQVSTHTESDQQWIAVAASASGDFVVAWESTDQDGSQGGVFARRFSSAGTALAAEFQVNTVTALRQGYPAVAMDMDGDFVIAWDSTEQDGSNRGIFGRRFSSAGTALASEFQVNTYVYGIQSASAVAAEGDGDFVVAWSSFEQDGYGTGVFAQRFSSAGAALASEFQVNAYTPGTQRFPAAVPIAGGGFVVAWQSAPQDGSGYGIFARRFSSAGAPLGGEVQVNTFTMGGQRAASVAAVTSGDFVVAWSSGQFGADYNVFGQRFTSAGAVLGAEFQVNSHTPSYQRYPTVAAGPGGGFVVAWESTSQDGDPPGVIGQRFSSAGAPLAGEFQVNAYTTYNQNNPVAASADGRFVVAWQSTSQDGDGFGVFAQRFAALMLLDVDGDGSTQPLTDGLLLLRYAFGFRGATLTTGAIGPGCTRCDAAAIEAYLAAHID